MFFERGDSGKIVIFSGFPCSGLRKSLEFVEYFSFFGLEKAESQ